MKKYYEKEISKTIKDINNISKQKILNIHEMKEAKRNKNEYKNEKIKSNIVNELDYNYLNQTSSSLYKMRKSNSSKKKIKKLNNMKNANLSNKNKTYKNSNKLLLNNNINYNQIKKRMNSLLDKEQLNMIYQKKFLSENNERNLSPSSQNVFNYFPRPEPFPKTINYNFSINNNLKCRSDYSNSKESTTGNSNGTNKKEDNNILYLLTNLNLSNLYNIFISNCISFNDLFLLSKEDFIEMKIPIGPRNRIIHFISEYKKYAKKFDFMELSCFINHYKQLMDNPNFNDINFTDIIDNQNNNIIYENKENYDINSIDKINKKGLLLLNSKSNVSCKIITSGSKEKNNNIHRLKKYNSLNCLENKDGTKNKSISQKNRITNYTIIQLKNLKPNAKEKKAILTKYSSKNYFKNYNINRNIKNKNNYEFLYQKFNNINQKVNDFQQNYSKIQKYSKYIDEKVSEYLSTKKIT